MIETRDLSYLQEVPIAEWLWDLQQRNSFNIYSQGEKQFFNEISLEFEPVAWASVGGRMVYTCLFSLGRRIGLGPDTARVRIQLRLNYQTGKGVRSFNLLVEYQNMGTKRPSLKTFNEEQEYGLEEVPAYLPRKFLRFRIKMSNAINTLIEEAYQDLLEELVPPAVEHHQLHTDVPDPDSL